MDNAPQNTGGRGDEIDEGLLARCENALVELSRALKAVNFYPRGHPTLNVALDKTRVSFDQALESQNQLGFAVSRSGFNFHSKPVAPNNTNLPPLAKELYHRQVKKVLFMPEITDREIENFLRVIAMEADLFRGKGKAEEYLQDNGVEHILLNEMKFGQTRAVPKKEEETKANGIDMEERVRQLIEALRSATDPRKFLATAREASVTALRFIGEENYGPAFIFLKTFHEIATADPPKPPLIAEGARSAFNELSISQMVEYMLRQLTLLHGPRQDEVLNVAKGLDERLVDSILDKLVTNEALYSHRALIQILLQMPDLCRKKVEDRLPDPNWFVVRKMAFLLGEMGDEESVAPLIVAAGNSDHRVVKEVLKSLSKIKSNESTKYLVELLSSKAPREIRAHTIRLLGAAKKVSVVPTLVKQLKRRGIFMEDIEIYTEFVRALGQIGSQQAVPILEELLFKKSMMAKARGLSLSIEAAGALGNIGGNRAIEVLKKGIENNNADIQAACRRALHAHEKDETESKNKGSETDGKRE